LPLFRTSGTTDSGSNILVVSDLHIGLDLRYGDSDGSQDEAMSRFVEFLDHFREHREGGRPWTLIINGDFFEFLGLWFTKMRGEDLPSEGGPARAVEVLDAVMNHQERVFRSLAEFLLAGNDLVIIYGNHDPHFHWEEIRRAFTGNLTTLAGEDAGWRVQKAVSRMAERIRFFPWFYLEGGGFYVEHGHQYDENCAMDNLLHPTDGEGIRFIRPSLASLGIRYFIQKVPRIDSVDYERMTMSEFFSWGSKFGVKNAIKISANYLYYILQVALMWRMSKRAERQSAWIRSQHRLRLLKLETETGLPPGVLLSLDRLKSVSSYLSLRKVLQLFYLDRFLLVLGVLVCAAGAFSLLPGFWKIAAAAWGWLSFLAGNQTLALFRRFRPGRRLAEVADSIIDLVGAPFILFGHTHRSESITIEGSGKCFNTGSWSYNRDPLLPRPYIKGIKSDDGLSLDLSNWPDHGRSADRI